MMPQLLLHLLGDYILQSDWMAKEKTRNSFAALSHAILYSLPFLILNISPTAFAVIAGTHFLIDRFRLAKYIIFAKNFLAPKKFWPKWENCKETGYHKNDPPWLSVWLMIISDNFLHILINFLAIKYL